MKENDYPHAILLKGISDLYQKVQRKHVQANLWENAKNANLYISIITRASFLLTNTLLFSFPTDRAPIYRKNNSDNQIDLIVQSSNKTLNEKYLVTGDTMQILCCASKQNTNCIYGIAGFQPSDSALGEVS